MATGVGANPALLPELQGAQKVLGQLHDWQVLFKEIQHLDAGSLAREKAVLDSVVSVESSRLHRKYLRLRDGIINVCTACTRLEGERHTLERLGRLATRTAYTARWLEYRWPSGISRMARATTKPGATPCG